MPKQIIIASLSAKGHWRGGVFHPAKPTTHSLDKFSDDQIKGFEDDPRLNVTHIGEGNQIPKPKMSSSETLIGSSSLPDVIQITDKIELQLGQLVAFAHQQSGLDVLAWNSLPEEERDVGLAQAIDLLKATANAAFDKKGKPNVDAVEAALKALNIENSNINGALRDAAFHALGDVDFTA